MNLMNSLRSQFKINKCMNICISIDSKSKFTCEFCNSYFQNCFLFSSPSTSAQYGTTSQHIQYVSYQNEVTTGLMPQPHQGHYPEAQVQKIDRAAMLFDQVREKEVINQTCNGEFKKFLKFKQIKSY